MRGSYLKKFVVVGLVVGLLLSGGAFSPSAASIVDPYYYGTGLAAFKVIDNFGGLSGTTGDGSVTLSIFTNCSVLKYELDGSPSIWQGVTSGPLTIGTGSNQSKIVYFQITNDSGTITTAHEITFSGSAYPFWNSVYLTFGENNSQFVLVVPQGSTDKVASVPIPASLWIFGSGLLGLIGIRRKITH